MDFFHTEGSGWLPACGLTTRPPTGPGTYFPVPMTVQAAMDNYWLVRDWQVRVTHSLRTTTNQGSSFDVQRYTEGQPTVVTWSPTWADGSQQPADSVCPKKRLVNISFSGPATLLFFDGTQQQLNYTRSLSFGFLSAPALGVGSWFWSDPSREEIWPNLSIAGFMDSRGSVGSATELAAASRFSFSGQDVPITFYDMPFYAGDTRSGGTQVELSPVYF